MKKNIFFTAVVMAGLILSGKTQAQDVPGSKKSDEIIIRKNDNVDKKMTIEIDGDNVTVNGKPLSEFHDGDVSIIKRDERKRGSKNFLYAPDNSDMDYEINNFDNGKPRTFLGVLSDKSTDGAKITEVVKGSGAEKAGLASGDIITKIDDKNIESPSELMEAVKAHKPGDEIKVYYLRDSKKKDTKAKLGETKENRKTMMFKRGPDMNNEDFNFNMPPMQKMQDLQRMPGMDNRLDRNFKFLYNSDKPKLGLKIEDTENGEGVKVLSVEENSPADIAGLKKDDLITSINGDKVESVDEIMNKINSGDEKEKMTIKAKRNNAEMNFEIKIPKKLNSADL